MPNDRDIDAPVSLGGLFGPDSDEDESEPNVFVNDSEEQSILVVGKKLKVRQFCFHTHNANRVWPGTFNLCEYYMEAGNGGVLSDLQGKDDDSWVLELGTATGLLAVRLMMEGVVNLVTSDVDDGGEVSKNVNYNFLLNDFEEKDVPSHVQHTWGTGWPTVTDEPSPSKPTSRPQVPLPRHFSHILASDILLYVSAYPALVSTLQELMPYPPPKAFADKAKVQKLVMSWNRRMPESQEFFERAKLGGFDCKHEGKCVFTFVRTSKGVEEGDVTSASAAAVEGV